MKFEGFGVLQIHASIVFVKLAVLGTENLLFVNRDFGSENLMRANRQRELVKELQASSTYSVFNFVKLSYPALLLNSLIHFPTFSFNLLSPTSTTKRALLLSNLPRFCRDCDINHRLQSNTIVFSKHFSSRPKSFRCYL